jgi:hypothetical protein
MFPVGRNHLSGQKSVQKRREKIEVFFSGQAIRQPSAVRYQLSA